jgi:sarcosine oxidase, subunit gamma
VLDLSIMRLNSLRRAAAEKPGTVELAILPDAAKLIFRGRDAAIDAVGKAFGVAPGREACRFASQGGRTVYWLGPDEWMLQASGENPVAIYDMLSAAMASHSCSLVDVSHRSDALSVTGHNAAWVLNHGCALNLSLSEFPVGMCTRTVIGKAAVILSRTDDDTFHIDVWRSFAPYVWQFLDEARSEL